jgi:hypothetical protein
MTCSIVLESVRISLSRWQGFHLFASGCVMRLERRMKEDQLRFLSLLGQLPARLTSEQAGWVLNCQAHDIPALVNARLLKPLGTPAQNGAKFFATADVLELTKDRSWLVKVTNTICQHWQRQNARRSLKLCGYEGELSGRVGLV